ncbi:uncharacterized protein [Aegilops tauschii subsp. strangulata]|uniref:uncharacterized protein n=1 Tax=Aegilops tauschii subsp. strangulata TaxID=200361 RepID=UPI003CC83E1D
MLWATWSTSWASPVKEDYNLDRSMKRDIGSSSEKLDGSRIWVDEVRRLSYTIEDMANNLLVRVEPDSCRSGFKELLHEGLMFLANDMTAHHQIDGVIRDIKSQVEVVVGRGNKYNNHVKNGVPNASAKATIDLRFIAIYVEMC